MNQENVLEKGLGLGIGGGGGELDGVDVDVKCQSTRCYDDS